MKQPAGFRPFNRDEEVSAKDLAQGERNRRQVFVHVVTLAHAGESVGATEVARWHRDLLAHMSYVPAACYLGAYRGSKHPWLAHYEVGAQGAEGVAALRVAGELDVFFDELAHKIQNLAKTAPPAQDKTREQVEQVAALAAWAHGE